MEEYLSYDERFQQAAKARLALCPNRNKVSPELKLREQFFPAQYLQNTAG